MARRRFVWLGVVTVSTALLGACSRGGSGAGGSDSRGVSEARIDELLVLDVKPAPYFAGYEDVGQHGAGALLFAHDAEVMGWLFAEG